MAGLDPVIYATIGFRIVDNRDKPGHDDRQTLNRKR
jgi:hypothetical protein